MSEQQRGRGGRALCLLARRPVRVLQRSPSLPRWVRTCLHGTMHSLPPSAPSHGTQADEVCRGCMLCMMRSLLGDDDAAILEEAQVGIVLLFGAPIGSGTSSSSSSSSSSCSCVYYAPGSATTYVQRLVSSDPALLTLALLQAILGSAWRPTVNSALAEALQGERRPRLAEL